MGGPTDLLGVYLELAELYGQQGQSAMRDRFLLLAADAALADGQYQEAERLREQFLVNNPHHIIRPYSSLAQALSAPEVSSYVSSLKKNYPPEVAHDLLQTLQTRSRRGPEDKFPTSPLPSAYPEETANLGGSTPSFPDHDVDRTADVGQTAPLPAWLPGTQLHLGKHDSSQEPPKTVPHQGQYGAPFEDDPDIPATLPPQRTPRGRREEVDDVPQTLPPQRKPRSPLPPRPAPAGTAPGSNWRGTVPVTESRSQPQPLYRAPTQRPVHSSAAPAPGDGEAEGAPSGIFVLLLFVLVMLAGLGLVGYTFIKPFLN